MLCMGFANGTGIGPIMCILYVTHIGPISNTHMRPIPFAKPIWGTHIDSDHFMGPILVPYGLAIWDPYWSHMGLLSGIHVGPIWVIYQIPIWDPCQSRLQTPYRSHMGLPAG